MKFNIKAHLKNHADFFQNNQEIYMSRDFRNNFYNEFEDELRPNLLIFSFFVM